MKDQLTMFMVAIAICGQLFVLGSLLHQNRELVNALRCQNVGMVYIGHDFCALAANPDSDTNK